MRILVVGGTGLIGAAIVARAAAAGHHVIGLARGGERSEVPGAPVSWRNADIGELLAPAHWMPLLDGIDAVVNCAGILQDAPGEKLRDIHATAISALVRACEQRGVRRLVHFSAIGVETEGRSAFSETKVAGDRAVAASKLDWVILRPSVVVGRAAYGGSALFRGLAALPLLPLMPDTAELQPVQLDDVVATALLLLEPDAPSRLSLDLAGPERLSLAEIVRTYRRWLGWGDVRSFAVPRPLAAIAYRAGDLAGWLGWRPPIRSNARKEMVRGATGDPRPWSEITAISPQTLAAALAATPVSVQERWFASLYFLKPVVLGILSLFWITTGLLSIGAGFDIGVALMQEGGAGPFSGPSVIAGGLADLAIGFGIAVRRTARPALLAGLAISLFYAAAGTLLVPRLWIDPLGPMVKIWPIFVLMLVALSLLRDR